MAERKKTSGSRYDQSPRQRKKKKRGFPWFTSFFMMALGAGGFVFFGYLGVLDHSVRKQFEGKRWAIPARVYASPVELYAGYNMSASKFEELLQTLHYRQDSNLVAEGTYVKRAQQIMVFGINHKIADYFDSRLQNLI